MFGFRKQQRNLQKGCQDLPRPDLENGQEAGAKQQEAQLSSNWNCRGGCHGGRAAKVCEVGHGAKAAGEAGGQNCSTCGGPESGVEAISFSFSQRALSVAKSHMRYHVCTEEAPLLVHIRVLVSRGGSGYRRIKDVVKVFGLSQLDHWICHLLRWGRQMEKWV